MEDAKEKKSRNYGYGLSAYGYGDAYGYAPSAGSDIISGQRGLRDYLAILRERIWYMVTTFLAINVAVLIYTFSTSPIYRSTASVEIFRRNPTVTQVVPVADGEVRTAEDINTQVDILNSDTIIQRVAADITGSDLERFLKPYPSTDGGPVDILKILEKHRKVLPERLSLLVDIEYEHPDKNISARVANLFASEYTQYSSNLRVEESLKAVEDLKSRADEQRKKVNDLDLSLQSYREKNNLVSLDDRKDIVTEKLKALDLQVTEDSATLQDAETRWKQVQNARVEKHDLLNLSFIASAPTVALLQQQVAASTITVAELTEHYRAKHPKMIEAVDSLKAAELQLRKAINNVAGQIGAAYQTALQDYNQAKGALADQEADSLSVDKFAVEYSNMERDFEVNEKLLEHLLGRMRETAMSSPIESETARIVDRARPPEKPIWPMVPLNLAVGVFSGLALGALLALFVDHFDDKIRNAYDIEVKLGLPILGVIPKFKGLPVSVGQPAQSTANRIEQEIAEAFAAIYSGIKTKEKAKGAQCILVTSTVPGEGKSFISRNLAATFASHGERTLLIDCDLRRPTAHSYYALSGKMGLLDFCNAGSPLADAIQKGKFPNLDILASPGRSKQPAQDLSSSRFQNAIGELRRKYDRIVIDTPPIALVTDALLLLPLVDAAIYAIFFDRVRGNAALANVRRMLEGNPPIFGAVLNGLKVNMAGYYYGQYYSKAYRDYYTTPEVP